MGCLQGRSPPCLDDDRCIQYSVAFPRLSLKGFSGERSNFVKQRAVSLERNLDANPESSSEFLQRRDVPFRVVDVLDSRDDALTRPYQFSQTPLAEAVPF